MLSQLVINNIVLIDHLSLDFSKGLTIVSGETGSGKSILLESLKLALGERCDTKVIKKGQDTAKVCAIFSKESLKKHPDVIDLLKDLDISVDDDLMLKRVLYKSGKTRAFINDEPTTIQTLKNVGQSLFEIHGQFDSLLTESHQKSLFDHFCAPHKSYSQQKGLVESAYHSWKKALKDLSDLDALEKESAEKKIYAQEIIKTLKPLDLKEGEEEEIRLEIKQREEAAKISTVVKEALSKMHNGGSDMSVLFDIERLFGRLQHLENDDFTVLKDQLSQMITLYQDFERNLSHMDDDLNETYRIQQDLQDRLHTLTKAAQKFYCDIKDLNGLYEQALETIDTIDNVAFKREELDKALKDAETLFKKESKALSEIRSERGSLLSKNVEKEFEGLSLKQARFKVSLETLENPSQWSREGMDNISFYVSMNPGQDFSPLSETASGGELSRVMLAIKKVTAQNHARTTILFDEIDQGVSGNVSTFIGKTLKDLSSAMQVITITHSPQICAQADHHILVSKSISQDTTTTKAVSLNEKQRIEEIGRMLSGEELTEEALQAAEKLLNSHQG